MLRSGDLCIGDYPILDCRRPLSDERSFLTVKLALELGWECRGVLAQAHFFVFRFLGKALHARCVPVGDPEIPRQLQRIQTFPSQQSPPMRPEHLRDLKQMFKDHVAFQNLEEDGTEDGPDESDDQSAIVTFDEAARRADGSARSYDALARRLGPTAARVIHTSRRLKEIVGGARRVGASCRTFANLGEMNVAHVQFIGTDHVLVATGSSVACWSVPGGVKRWERTAREGAVERLAVSADGRWIAASGDASPLVMLTDAHGSSHYLEGHADLATVVAIDGERVITASADRTVRVWDAATAKAARVIRCADLSSTDQASYMAARLTDGRNILIPLGFEQRIIVWSLAKEKRLREFNLMRTGRMTRGTITALDTLPCSESLIAGYSVKGDIGVWDSRSGRPTAYLDGHCAKVSSVAADERLAFSASADWTLRVWSLATGQAIGSFDTARDVICTMALSADGKWLVTGSLGGRLSLWNRQLMVP